MTDISKNLNKLKSKILARFKILYRLIGIVIFIVIISRLDLEQLIKNSEDIQINYILGALALIILVFIFKSMRWNSLLRLHGINCTIFETWRMYMAGAFVGTVTPGRVGELVKIFYLKRKNDHLSYGKLIFNVFIDKSLDIFVVFSVSIAGLLFYFKEYRGQLLIINILIIIAIIFFYYYRHGVIDLMAVLLKKLSGKQLHDKVDIKIDELKSNIHKLRTKHMVYPFIYNIVAYIIFYSLVYLILLSLHVKMNIVNLSFALSTAMLFSMLPISFGGIGTRDIILIFFFSKYNISNEITVSFSLLYLLVCIITPALVGFFLYIRESDSVKQKWI